MISLYFFGNDRLAKNNKVAGYQLLPPTLVVVVTVSFFPFQHPAILQCIFASRAFQERF